MDVWDSLYQPGMRLVPDRIAHTATFAAAGDNVDINLVVVIGGSIYIRGVEICTADDNPYNNYWERQLEPAGDLEFTAAALDIFSTMKLAPEMLRENGHLHEFVARSAGAYFCPCVYTCVYVWDGKKNEIGGIYCKKCSLFQTLPTLLLALWTSAAWRRSWARANTRIACYIAPSW